MDWVGEYLKLAKSIYPDFEIPDEFKGYKKDWPENKKRKKKPEPAVFEKSPKTKAKPAPAPNKPTPAPKTAPTKTPTEAPVPKTAPTKAPTPTKAPALKVPKTPALPKGTPGSVPDKAMLDQVLRVTKEYSKSLEDFIKNLEKLPAPARAAAMNRLYNN